MRIGILGASGRVGTSLVELIVSNPGLELAAALVSPDPASALPAAPVFSASIVSAPHLSDTRGTIAARLIRVMSAPRLDDRLAALSSISTSPCR